VFEWDMATLKRYVRILKEVERDLIKRKKVDHEVKMVISLLTSELDSEMINWMVYNDKNNRNI
jgi:ferredoxin-fold anticodon binding domain-containing protein